MVPIIVESARAELQGVIPDNDENRELQIEKIDTILAKTVSAAREADKRVRRQVFRDVLFQFLSDGGSLSLPFTKILGEICNLDVQDVVEELNSLANMGLITSDDIERKLAERKTPVEGK